MNIRLLNVSLCVAIVSLFGCSSAYFSAMEKIGYPKRQIFVSRLEKARDSQHEAKDQFKSSLDKFKTVLGTPRGDLDEKYNALKNSYETSAAKAEAVRQRIASVENVSDALFYEWSSEIDSYSSKSLQAESARKLRETKILYKELLTSMKSAERKLEPALVPFRDNLLFLKHNLNARAFGSLRGELSKIEENVSALIAELNRSIDDSGKLIKQIDYQSGIEN